MNFNKLPKPPPEDDAKGWYRWHYRVTEILNGLIAIALSHDQIENVAQADPTSSDTTAGKHVTDAQVKRYEDGVTASAAHIAITNANPHGTDWDMLESTASVIPFNSGASTPTYGEGKIFYDSGSHSLAYYNDANGVTVNLGQEELVRVYNNTASPLTDGQMVYITGATGGFPAVTLAKADTAPTSQSTLGMVTNTIAVGSYGYITTSGLVHGLNTNAYTAGTTLYLSESTAGAWTSTPPLQPNYVVEIGTVTAQSASVGAIYAHIDKKPWHPSLELLDSTASTALPTTATVYKPATTVKAEGFSYDSSTGIFVFNESGSFSLTFLLNASPSASNKNIYFYIETSYNGGSWAPIQYSARELKLANATETQLLIAGSKYFPKLTSMRFYLWGDATVTLKTTDLPGTTPGTVTLPAGRIMIA